MFEVTILSSRTFPAVAGQSLVEAAEAAGLVLPYSCRTGRCSTCRLRVAAGITIAQEEEIGLTSEERAGGWILGCVREAASDLVIDVEDLTSLDLPPPRTLPCRIQEIEDLGPEVRRVTLRLPPTSHFTFLPGQYVEIIGRGGLRRSYSLAAAPETQRELELHIRRVPNGAMSEYWFETAELDDLLRLHGPLGTFVLREVVGEELVFLATGTGIAPIKAMLEQIALLAPEQRPRATHLLWGGRTESDLYLDPRQAYSDVHYLPTLSRPAGSWRGSRLYVQDAAFGMGIELSQAKVYACGSERMINSAFDRLTAASLPPSSFFSDAFICSW